MKFAKLNGFTNYKDTFSALYPKPWMEVFFEIFYIVILLAAVAAAVAGAGEVLANFFGVDYSVTANKLIFNLIIVAVLIILSIFGVKLVIAASTVLSIAILISHRNRRYRRLRSRLRRNQRKPACSEQYHGSTVC